MGCLLLIYSWFLVALSTSSAVYDCPVDRPLSLDVTHCGGILDRNDQHLCLLILITCYRCLAEAGRLPIPALQMPGIKPLTAPPMTPRAGAMMASGALPNLPNCPDSRAACKHSIMTCWSPGTALQAHNGPLSTIYATEYAHSLQPECWLFLQ